MMNLDVHCKTLIYRCRWPDAERGLAELPLATFVRTGVLRGADRTVAAESVAALSCSGQIFA